MKVRLAIGLLLLLIPAQLLKGQDTLFLQWQPDWTHEVKLDLPEQPERFTDSLAVVDYVQEVQLILLKAGYLTNSLEQIERNRDTLIANLNTGPRYQWAMLRPGNLESRIAQQAGFRERYFNNEQLSLEQLSGLFDKIITLYEDNGYPFASVRLDSLTIEGASLSGALYMVKGPLITIDTLMVLGEANISNSFLEPYLDIESGDVYNEEVIRNIASRIRSLTFLRMTRNPEVQFIRDQARVVLYLESSRASRFDFLIGILPNNAQQGGKLLINGEATVNLINAFGTGKTLMVEWHNLQPRSPRLDARLIYPYIARLPVGFDGQFHLYKRDTFYVDIEGELGLQYLLGGQDYIKAYSTLRSTNLITVDTQTVKATKTLPTQLDARYRLFGLEYHGARTDNIYTPRRGWEGTLNVAVGTRAIKPNNTIINLDSDVFDYATLYDTLADPTLTIRGKVNIAKYWPLSRYLVLKTGVETGYLYGESLISNELYRIGGMKLLRGFDEESVLASWYNVATVELRFLIGANSYFNAFWDGGYLQRDQREMELKEFWPYGFGAGLTFETGAGIFAVSYALGRLDNENPIRFRNAKIHFGYLSYF